MNALSSLHSGRSEDSDNVNALLGSTHEIEKRLPEVNRWLKLWKKDVREGWAVLGRFKVSLLSCALFWIRRFCILYSICRGDLNDPLPLGEVTCDWRQ